MVVEREKSMGGHLVLRLDWCAGWVRGTGRQVGRTVPSRPPTRRPSDGLHYLLMSQVNG